MRGLMLAIVLSLMAAGSAMACSGPVPGGALPPGAHAPRGAHSPEVDAEIVQRLRSGIFAPADLQRIRVLILQDFERHLQSAQLGPADRERAQALLDRVRAHLERGEIQLAGDAGDTFMRILGHHRALSRCNARPRMAPPATTAGPPVS